MDEASRAGIRGRVDQEIEEAVQRADAQPFPSGDAVAEGCTMSVTQIATTNTRSGDRASGGANRATCTDLTEWAALPEYPAKP